MSFSGGERGVFFLMILRGAVFLEKFSFFSFRLVRISLCVFSYILRLFWRIDSIWLVFFYLKF